MATNNDLFRYGIEGISIVAISALLNGTPIFTNANIQTGLMAAVTIFLVDTMLEQYSEGFRFGAGFGLGQKLV